jgi:hypothetical protein
MDDVPLSEAPLRPEELKRLLARVRIIQSICDMDLLTFLYRHPRAILTSEQLTEFVGYPLKDIAKTLETFIDARVLERTAQHSGHAARMYLLLLDGPLGGGLRTLLQMASTPQGRQGIVEALNGDSSIPVQPGGTQALILVK